VSSQLPPLIECPHIDSAAAPLTAPSRLRWRFQCAALGCACGELWTCLICGDAHCSRFTKGMHALGHYETVAGDPAAAVPEVLWHRIKHTFKLGLQM